MCSDKIAGSATKLSLAGASQNPSYIMSTTPSTEDRVWTILAHLSALSLGMGILLPIVGWSDQRRKSNYASFQCLQALGYQSLGFTVWVLSYLVLVILASIILLLVLMPEGSRQPSPDTLRPVLIIFLIIVLGPLALYLVLPIIAAVACALGKDFRYPVMGNRLARYLGYEFASTSEEQSWLNEDHEFRWVAAMGHFSILILLWGMLAPLTACMVQGKSSRFLRFQSIQTLVYQAGATLLFVLGGFMYAVGIALLPFLFLSSSSLDLNSPVTIAGLVIFAVLILIAMLIILIVPLLHILGQWAGYRVLKGEDYRYPVVGRWVDRWISKNSSVEEISS